MMRILKLLIFVLLLKFLICAIVIIYTTYVNSHRFDSERIERAASLWWDEIARLRAEEIAELERSGPDSEEYLRKKCATIDVEMRDMYIRPEECFFLKRWEAGHDVKCWPSSGGIIIADFVSRAEIDYLGLDPEQTIPRSKDQSMEDEFCMKVRKIGGKWWAHFRDYDNAIGMQARPLYPDEREILFLAWPPEGGVCVLRFDHFRIPGVQDLRQLLKDGSTMEERCHTMMRSGAAFFERPMDSEHVRPFLEGFGDHEDRDHLSIEDGGWWDNGYHIPA